MMLESYDSVDAITDIIEKAIHEADHDRQTWTWNNFNRGWKKAK
jgi:hypothetical protein